MGQFDRRLSVLESKPIGPRMSLEHVPDDALSRMEEILSTKSVLDLNAEETAFFQAFGFLGAEPVDGCGNGECS
jgi:hypothetical protein